MTAYARGGFVSGPSVPLLYVKETSEEGRGALNRIFADECIIGVGLVCRRTDELHRKSDVPEQRFWRCPVKDAP